MADESIRVPIDGDTSGFDQKVEGMKGTISAASVAMGNLLSDMGKKALSAFGDMISSGDEFNKAINQMSSSGFGMWSRMCTAITSGIPMRMPPMPWQRSQSRPD